MIVINNLSNKINQNNYTFSDINLDFALKQVSNNRRNNDVVVGNDIIADVDERAILNSIENLLTQKRYLTPSFGVNLKNFIGQPLSDLGASALGNTIDTCIKLYEPRITLQKILVAPDYDNFLYQIAIIILMPNLNNKQVVINTSFNNTGDFTFNK